VSNGSPHNLFGQYTRMRVGKIRLSIQHQLSEIPTDQWSTEPLSGWRNGGLTVVLPPLEADLELMALGVCHYCLQQWVTLWMHGASPWNWPPRNGRHCGS